MVFLFLIISSYMQGLQWIYNCQLKKKKRKKVENSLFSQSFTGWLHFVLLWKTSLYSATAPTVFCSDLSFCLEAMQREWDPCKMIQRTGTWGWRRMECGCCVGLVDVAWEKDLGRFWEEGCNTGETKKKGEEWRGKLLLLSLFSSWSHLKYEHGLHCFTGRLRLKRKRLLFKKTLSAFHHQKKNIYIFFFRSG